MPEPIIAASPSPVVAAVAPSAAAKTSPADGTSASSADGQATTPFAVALQHQMGKPADDKAAKTVAAVLKIDGKTGVAETAAAKDDGTAADKTDDAAADALAFLAPMLAGIAPQAPDQDKKLVATKDGDAEQAPATAAVPTDATAPVDAAVPIAAPAPIAVVAAAVAAPAKVSTNTALPTTTQPAAASPQALPTSETPDRTSANLAPAATAVTENAESTGKSGNSAQTSFDSLLNASREASITAANNAAAAHAPHVVANQTSSAATAIQVATPVGDQGWNGEIGEKITWMANQQVSHAELVLNPPHLGRIEVSLSMNGDQANAVFVSASPAVREALENAVPHLREVLQGAGISLGQTQVGAESFQQQANNRENGDNSRQGSARDTGATANGFIAGSSSPSQWLRRGNGLVDTFA